MRYDRRKNVRVKVNLPARWEGVLQRHEATVTSISVNGCFLLSAGKVLSKELVRVEIFLPNEAPIYVWAEVVDDAYEIGFAARFTSPSDEANEVRLGKYLEAALNKAK